MLPSQRTARHLSRAASHRKAVGEALCQPRGDRRGRKEDESTLGPAPRGCPLRPRGLGLRAGRSLLLLVPPPVSGRSEPRAQVPSAGGV